MNEKVPRVLDVWMKKQMVRWLCKKSGLSSLNNVIWKVEYEGNKMIDKSNRKVVQQKSKSWIYGI